MSNVQLVVGKLKEFGIAHAHSSYLLSTKGMKINKQFVYVKYDSRRLDVYVSCEPGRFGVRNTFSLEEFCKIEPASFIDTIQQLARHYYDKDGNFTPPKRISN